MIEDKIITYSDPKSSISETFRTLRTNIQFAISGTKNVNTILITSSLKGEGKSWNSANIAAAFAMQGKKTLLIDADMRRGTQHKLFDLKNSNGLSNYLADVNWNENSLIKKTDIDNLFIITCGKVPPNPSELLSSNRMTELLSTAKENFDIIILDGPPVLLVSDSLILAKDVDSVIIVAAAKETKKEVLKTTTTSLQNVGAKLGGVVLNKIDISDKNRYSKYKYYGYYNNYNNMENK